MSNWKITEKRSDTATNAAMNICSAGLYGLFGEKSYIYKVENEETGETKTVRYVSNEEELGKQIAKGKFEPD